MRNLSLGVKLLGLFGLLLLLVFGVVTLYISRNVRSDFVQEATNRASDGLEAMRWLIEHKPTPHGERELQEWVTQIGKRLHFRVTYIHEGRVVADSEVPFEKLEGLDDHAGRPEVLQAREQGIGTSIRFSRTLGKELLYAAMPVEPTPGAPGGVLRLAIPISDIQARYQEFIPQAFLFMLAVFAVAGVLGLFIIRRMSASIQTFAHTAQQIGEGDYSKRIWSVPGKEFTPLMRAVNTMSVNIQSHIEGLQDAKGELEALFNGMSSGAMILGRDGLVESWNRALEELFPDMGDATGKTPLEVTMQPGLRKMAEAMRTSPEGTTRMDLQFDAPRRKVLHATLVPFRTPKGVRKIVILFHDITEIKRLERVRQDFMINITHEIRTPITSIHGYAETLLDNPDIKPVDRDRFLGIILENSRHMAEMVKKLLSLAKLDAESAPKLEPVSLREQLLMAVRTLSQPIETRGVRVLDELPETPLFVKATKVGLFEVLVNLLENAVTYGPEKGDITVSIRTGEDKDVVLQITDQGEGIPGIFKDRIFERFFRIEEGRSMDKGRYGLGLAICRQLVTGFGGSIWLESPADPFKRTGTRFCVSLRPCEPRDDSEEGARA